MDLALEVRWLLSLRATGTSTTASGYKCCNESPFAGKAKRHSAGCGDGWVDGWMNERRALRSTSERGSHTSRLCADYVQQGRYKFLQGPPPFAAQGFFPRLAADGVLSASAARFHPASNR